MTAENSNPVIIITPGEPAGIGPDICIQLAQLEGRHRWGVLADRQLLEARAKELDLPLRISCRQNGAEFTVPAASEIQVIPITLENNVEPGKLDKANAAYVLSTLDRAIDGCQRGEFDALVTGPVHKGIINEAGIPFSGHTEYLAGVTGGHPVMMLTTSELRVALATTHLPLAKVTDAITQAVLEKVLTILHDDLSTRFGLTNPRILVCGLNPHAGEGGHLGTEEIEIIEPVLNRLRESGIDAIGPLPADTVFTEKALANADAVLAMYHDQGLPVLKHRGFGKAANITLGLPIIRTSVDHGTALDLAGTGLASIGSLQTAMEMAVQMAGSHV